MISIIKTTVRLLLRNKGFLFFLLITPIISTLILSLKVDHETFDNNDKTQISELGDLTERAIYAGNNYAFIVKVYDGAGTELSEYTLNRLAENGMFSVCRADVKSCSYDRIIEQAKKDGFDDRAGVILYLNDSFDSAVMEDRLADGIELFMTSADEREELFETDLTDILSKEYRAGLICGGDISKTIDMLDTISEKLPEKKTVDVTHPDETVLTAAQNNMKTQIGYALAFITLGFMFSGVFASHTVITEQNNKVFTRLMLTGTSTAKYFTAKFLVVVMMCLLQTGVFAVCLQFLKGLDIGMPIPVFLLIVFMLGVIFGTFSMLTGILFGDIMSSNYAAFAFWSISAMLSGLLFPINDSAAFLKTISYLMPQRWFIDVSERFITGLSGAYPMLLCVTAAYLIVIISVGSVGLKIRKPMY